MPTATVAEMRKQQAKNKARKAKDKANAKKKEKPKEESLVDKLKSGILGIGKRFADDPLLDRIAKRKHMAKVKADKKKKK